MLGWLEVDKEAQSESVNRFLVIHHQHDEDVKEVDSNFDMKKNCRLNNIKETLLLLPLNLGKFHDAFVNHEIVSHKIEFLVKKYSFVCLKSKINTNFSKVDYVFPILYFIFYNNDKNHYFIFKKMTHFHDGLCECHYFTFLFVSSLSLCLHLNAYIQLNYIVYFNYFFFVLILLILLLLLYYYIYIFCQISLR